MGGAARTLSPALAGGSCTVRSRTTTSEREARRALTAPNATAAPTPKKISAAKLSAPQGKGRAGGWLATKNGSEASARSRCRFTRKVESGGSTLGSRDGRGFSTTPEVGRDEFGRLEGGGGSDRIQ